MPRNSRRYPLRFSLLVFVAAAACALFLPFFGSLFDHHFTDRHPGHGHFYIGGQPFEHLHPFETTHAHGQFLVDSGASGSIESQGGVIFIPPDDKGVTWSSGFSLAAALLTTAVLIIPPMQTLVPQAGHPVLRAFIPTLEPPPPRPAL